MGGFFGVASKEDCVFDLFFGTDYHSHLGTRRGGMVTYGENGFDRSIHKIENAPFRTNCSLATRHQCHHNRQQDQQHRGNRFFHLQQRQFAFS